MMDDTATTPTPEPVAPALAPEAVGPAATEAPVAEATVGEAPIAEAPAVEPVAAPVVDGDRIGRFSRADLEALRGRRGRKPAEYYVLFPETSAAKPAKAPRSADKPAARRAPQPRISSAILGDHSIDALLAKAGTKGAKPPAYGILVAAAEHLVEAGAVAAPAIADPLARRVAEAPARVRRLVEALLAAAG